MKKPFCKYERHEDEYIPSCNTVALIHTFECMADVELDEPECSKDCVGYEPA